MTRRKMCGCWPSPEHKLNIAHRWTASGSSGWMVPKISHVLVSARFDAVFIASRSRMALLSGRMKRVCVRRRFQSASRTIHCQVSQAPQWTNLCHLEVHSCNSYPRTPRALIPTLHSTQRLLSRGMRLMRHSVDCSRASRLVRCPIRSHGRAHQLSPVRVYMSGL